MGIDFEILSLGGTEPEIHLRVSYQPQLQRTDVKIGIREGLEQNSTKITETLLAL